MEKIGKKLVVLEKDNVPEEVDVAQYKFHFKNMPSVVKLIDSSIGFDFICVLHLFGT